MSIERAILKGTIANAVQIRNMFTCEVTPVGSDTSPVLWAAYMSSLLDTIPELVSEVVNFYSYETQLQVGFDWDPLDVVTIDVDGLRAVDTLPNQSALVLIAKTAGRYGIGRKFFSGIAEESQSAGIVIIGMAALAAEVLLAWITPFTGLSGGTIVPGVVAKGGGFRPFVGGFMSSVLGSMRRRKPGLGI